MSSMSRLGQRITIPVLLSHDLNQYVAFFSTVLPVASYVAVHHFFIIPRKRRRIAEYVSFTPRGECILTKGCH